MAFPTIELDGQTIDLELDPYVTVVQLISQDKPTQKRMACQSLTFLASETKPQAV